MSRVRSIANTHIFKSCHQKTLECLQEYWEFSDHNLTSSWHRSVPALEEGQPDLLQAFLDLVDDSNSPQQVVCFWSYRNGPCFSLFHSLHSDNGEENVALFLSVFAVDWILWEIAMSSQT